MNFLHAEVDASGLRVGSHVLDVAAALPLGTIKLGIRPEYVALADAQTPGALPMLVSQVQDVGTHNIVTASHHGQTVKARLSTDSASVQTGSTVWLQVMGAHTCFYKNEEIVA